MSGQQEEQKPIKVANKAQAIELIEKLYPADHPHPMIHLPGIRMLERARGEHWRDEPEEVLIRYAELCLEKQYTLERQGDRNEESGI